MPPQGLGHLATRKSSSPGQKMICLIESDIGAKIAMASMKDISYYNTISADGNIEHSPQGEALRCQLSRVSGFLEKPKSVWQER